MVERAAHPPGEEVTIAMVGKYVELHDAYLSIVEALTHGGIHHGMPRWTSSGFSAEDVTDRRTRKSCLADCDGILVPGGFGYRGMEGKIDRRAIRPGEEDALPGHLPGHADGGGGVCPPRAGPAGRQLH